MQKSKIEWTDYTINPVKGLCPMACSYCYARRMYKRFGWQEAISYDCGWEDEIAKIKKPSKIFVGSTMELFGSWVLPSWREDILKTVAKYPQHTFIFLTKQPHKLPKIFPNNCWVGVSATDSDYFASAVNHLMSVNARVKFVSIEPLLDWKPLDIETWMRQITWVIIGQQTPQNVKTMPKLEWIKKIVETADKTKTPVFLKNNLTKIIPDDADWAYDILNDLRQELP